MHRDAAWFAEIAPACARLAGQQWCIRPVSCDPVPAVGAVFAGAGDLIPGQTASMNP